MLNDFYRFKTILITGNTGFKGSWLSHWLISLGAKVVGYSKDIPGDPSLFCSLGLEDKIAQHYEDIRDFDALKRVIEHVRPDLIFILRRNRSFQSLMRTHKIQSQLTLLE